MATTNDLLFMMEATSSMADATYYEVDPFTREISVPSDLILGVESDEASNRLRFRCPKIVGDNIDLTTSQIRIVYNNANGEIGYYDCIDAAESVEVPGVVEFSWSLERKVTKYKGEVSFIVRVVNFAGSGTISEWNTVEAYGTVLKGLNDTEIII